MKDTGVKNNFQASVIIPHYNRLDALCETLISLADQTLPPYGFEVLVVDDGSQEPIDRMISELGLPYSVKVFAQNHRGAASARNLGAREAKGDLLIFLDCDMVTSPEFLMEHIQSHSIDSPALVAGPRETWHGIQPAVAADLLEVGTRDTDLRLYKSPLTFYEALTCNLSIQTRHWSKLKGFDEQFPPASGFEDVEFAYRAAKMGFPILLNPKAVAYHNHPQTIQQCCRQAQHYQQSVALLLQKHPELRSTIAHLRDKEPIEWRSDSLNLICSKAIRHLLAWRPVLWVMERAFISIQRQWPSSRLENFLYWKVIGSYQMIGLREGIKLYGWPGRTSL